MILLRVWFEPSGEQLVWRASVLPPRGSRRYFSSPDALLAALDRLVRPSAEAESGPG